MATITTKTMEKAAAPPGGFWHEMFRVGIYKSSQGRITRQVTAVSLIAIIALACYRLWLTMLNAVLWTAANNQPVTFGPTLPYLVPAIVLLAGVWFSYRLVNVPQFADFLIAVEAEMNKVSWPSVPELRRASAVVIFVMFALAIVLFTFDAIWQAAASFFKLL